MDTSFSISWINKYIINDSYMYFFLFGPIVDAIALRKTLIITPILQF